MNVIKDHLIDPAIRAVKYLRPVGHVICRTTCHVIYVNVERVFRKNDNISFNIDNEQAFSDYFSRRTNTDIYVPI